MRMLVEVPFRNKATLKTFLTQGRIRQRKNFWLCAARSFSSESKQFKVLFLGRDEFSCTVLRGLHAAEDVWSQIHIVTHPDEKVGRRGSVLSVSPLKLLGQSLKIPVHEIPRERRNFRHWEPPEIFVSSSDPPSSHIIITASFGRILSTPLLRRFLPTRRLNVHPSNLPAYRGAAPIQHTLLNADKSTGVCAIAMLGPKEGIDSGGVWGRRTLQIKDGTDFEGLRDTLAKEGGQLLVDVLRGMRAGKAHLTAQADGFDYPLAPKITAADAAIDFNTMNANAVVRRYRAIGHQRPLTAQLESGKSLQIHSPSVLSPTTASPPAILAKAEPGVAVFDPRSLSLVMKCAEETYLLVAQIKQEGRPLLHSKDWWNGIRSIGGVVQGLVRFGS